MPDITSKYNKMQDFYNPAATAQAAPPPQEEGGGGLKGLLAGFLPLIGGGLGALGGSFVAPVAGTAAGGAAGSALGEALKQKLLGKQLDAKEIAIQGALGAVPGVLGGAGKLIKGARGAGEVASAVKGAETAAEGGGLLSKFTKAGKSLRQEVVSPQVRAGVGGAQKEAEIAERVSRIPGLTAKSKYGNLQGEMNAIGSKIEPQLAKAKGTVGSEDLLTNIRSNANESGHFLAGDTAYEKQLNSVISDISAKTGGVQKLNAKQLYDYKKGMDMNAVFTKLEKGADLNPKEAARLAVWSSLDTAITKAAPGVKSLTKEQSLLMQGASGLKKGADKTLGIPLLGIKSKKAEQAIQAGKEVVGRGAEFAGGGATATSSSPSFLRSLIGPTVKQGVTRVAASPFLPGAEQPESPGMGMGAPQMPGAELGGGMSGAMGAEMGGAGGFFSDPQQVQSAYLEALNAGDSSTASAIIKGYELFGGAGGEGKLGATQQQQATNAMSGLEALQTIQSELQRDPSLQAKTVLPGRGLLGGLGNRALGTGVYETSRKQAMDVIARLRTGAAISDKEEQLYMSMVPEASDSPETVDYKLQSLAQLFGRFASPTPAAPDYAPQGAMAQPQGAY